MPSTPPVVLTIAGFDPSSGAGVTADIKTIAAHGCYGVSCITALTVQSTVGVWRVDPINAGLVDETLQELAQDVEIAAVHIGMLASEAVVDAVATFLSARNRSNVVLDPVIRSSSGAELLSAGGVRKLVEKLLPLVAVITPNLDEAATLTGLPVRNLEEMRRAANRLHSMGAAAVVVTGGHLDQAVDLLSFAHGTQQQAFEGERQHSKSTHGTGCAFATAMACELAHGTDLSQAVSLAKGYVATAIKHAYPLGRGTGPVNHLYGMREPEATIPVVDGKRNSSK
jgi:hydroxymethylpyrimidine/phosphomethylpyrimidine kinase